MQEDDDALQINILLELALKYFLLEANQHVHEVARPAPPQLPATQSLLSIEDVLGEENILYNVNIFFIFVFKGVMVVDGDDLEHKVDMLQVVEQEAPPGQYFLDFGILVQNLLLKFVLVVLEHKGAYVTGQDLGLLPLLFKNLKFYQQIGNFMLRAAFSYCQAEHG